MKAILNNWLAKLLSLVLAVILWLVIHRNLATTASHSNFQFGVDDPSQVKGNFQFDVSSHGNPKK